MVMDIHKAFPHVPVILGGGTDLTNVSSRLALADGALVGSCFQDGNWGGMINEATVAAYMEQVRKLKFSRHKQVGSLDGGDRGGS